MTGMEFEEPPPAPVNKGQLFDELKTCWNKVRGATKTGEPVATNDEEKAKAKIRINEIQKELGLAVTDWLKPRAPKSSGGQSFYKKPTMTVEEKMVQLKALDEFIATLAMKRLEVVEQGFGKIAVPEKLIFLESWARTIAMTLGK